MDKYFENNLNTGEKIEVEIKHSKLYILANVIHIVKWLIIALVLNYLGNLVLNWAGKFSSSEDGTNILVKIFSIIKNVIIWGGFAVIIFIIIINLLQVLTTKLAITNRRVIGKFGLFGSSSLDYPIEKIDNVSVNTPFFGKIFHYSSIKIKSTNDNGIEFENVTNANEFRNALTAAIANNAEEARKAQASDIASAMKNA